MARARDYIPSDFWGTSDTTDEDLEVHPSRSVLMRSGKKRRKLRKACTLKKRKIQETSRRPAGNDSNDSNNEVDNVEEGNHFDDDFIQTSVGNV